MGNEKINEVFSKKEQGYKCLDYLIEYVHFNPKYLGEANEAFNFVKRRSSI